MVYGIALVMETGFAICAAFFHPLTYLEFSHENPLGKTIEIKEDNTGTIRRRDLPESDDWDYEITGVVENSPSNTHFKYDIILSLKQLRQNVLRQSWHDRGTYTYVKLTPDVNAKDFEKQISLLAYDYIGKQLESWGQKRSYFLQPLVDIHFHERKNTRV